MPGKYTLAGSIFLLALLIAAVSAQESGSLIRGNTFTVTVIGDPVTAYDIWPKGTHFMTGEPGDQPPIIVPGQVNVAQDPPGGPYLIGSTRTGGGTILDDVPPSTPEVPNTSYYAQVTTDVSGYGTLLFQTSSATATQQFHITAQNPADPSEEVQVILGVPAPVPTSVVPLPLPPTIETPFLPPPTTHLPVTPVQTTPAATPVPPQTTSPTATPVQNTPVARTALPDSIGIAAAGIGLLWAGRVRGE